MSKAESSEQFDTDILQCKVDILRARDVIPPHDDATPKNPATQNNAINEDTSPIPIEEIPPTAPLPRPVVSINKKEEAETLQEKSEIPSFDLAEEIMAEQRKITAIRRKAPGKKTDNIEQPTSALSEQEKIIAEIVARDIERLCGGDYSANSE